MASGDDHVSGPEPRIEDLPERPDIDQPAVWRHALERRWVVDDGDGSVRRIDPATNTIAATVGLTRGASWFADDGKTILVANRLDGSISALDPASGTPGQPITGGKGPLDGTVLGDRAYIPDGRARTLIEIDLGSQTIAALDDLDGTLDPFVAEGAFGDLWVLDHGGKRILRIRP